MGTAGGDLDLERGPPLLWMAGAVTWNDVCKTLKSVQNTTSNMTFSPHLYGIKQLIDVKQMEADRMTAAHRVLYKMILERTFIILFLGQILVYYNGMR